MAYIGNPDIKDLTMNESTLSLIDFQKTRVISSPVSCKD